MGSLAVYENNLFVGINQKLFILSKGNREILTVVPIVPTPQPTEKDDGKNVKKTPLKQDFYVQNLAISSNGRLLALTVSGLKLLFIFEVNGLNLKLLSERSIPRSSSALKFTNDSGCVLVSDKTGDCNIFDCNTISSPPTWLLGHLSIVLDILFSPSDKHIITCDRDEKIRVTSLPNSFEIECYCLGHVEFVSAIKFWPMLPDKYLVSISGDKTLKIWNYENGNKLFSLELPAPGLRLAIRQVSENRCHAAVVLFRPEESLVTYEISFENDQFKADLKLLKDFRSVIISNLEFCEEDLVVTTVQKTSLTVEILAWDGKNYHSGPTDRWSQLIAENLENQNIHGLDNVSQLFKKKFDNVADYMERKRRRIEEKDKNRSA